MVIHLNLITYPKEILFFTSILGICQLRGGGGMYCCEWDFEKSLCDKTKIASESLSIDIF